VQQHKFCSSNRM